MLVQLSAQEIMLAANAGVVRRVRAISANAQRTHGQPDNNRWEQDIEGCCAEVAVCKALGIYWTGAERIRANDAGSFDVRYTPHPNGCLILHDEDPDRRFVLVIGKYGVYRLAGWIDAVEGKVERFWGDKGHNRPAYWIPQDELHPMDTLDR
jgi:hypothetical protein